jgi:vacuolar-type H+-ATPase subunit I/STV1
MPRKKKSKASSKVVSIKEPSDNDGDLYFSDTDLLRLQLMQHKLQGAAQAVQLKLYEITEFRRHIELRAQTLDQQLKQLQEDQRAVESKYREFQDEIREKYGVGLDEISYDDETGKITLLEKSEDIAEEEPAEE